MKQKRLGMRGLREDWFGEETQRLKRRFVEQPELEKGRKEVELFLIFCVQLYLGILGMVICRVKE